MFSLAANYINLPPVFFQFPKEQRYRIFKQEFGKSLIEHLGDLFTPNSPSLFYVWIKLIHSCIFFYETYKETFCRMFKLLFFHVIVNWDQWLSRSIKRQKSIKIFLWMNELHVLKQYNSGRAYLLKNIPNIGITIIHKTCKKQDQSGILMTNVFIFGWNIPTTINRWLILILGWYN